jgi:hypothetical protein
VERPEIVVNILGMLRRHVRHEEFHGLPPSVARIWHFVATKRVVQVNAFAPKFSIRQSTAPADSAAGLAPGSHRLDIHDTQNHHGR